MRAKRTQAQHITVLDIFAYKELRNIYYRTDFEASLPKIKLAPCIKPSPQSLKAKFFTNIFSFVTQILTISTMVLHACVYSVEILVTTYFNFLSFQNTCFRVFQTPVLPPIFAVRDLGKVQSLAHEHSD